MYHDGRFDNLIKETFINKGKVSIINYLANGDIVC